MNHKFMHLNKHLNKQIVYKMLKMKQEKDGKKNFLNYNLVMIMKLLHIKKMHLN